MAVPTNNAPPTTSIADLITEFHKTKGVIPPLLIGATATLIEDKVYLFGGRLQSTRQVSNRLYILDMQTKTWTTTNPESTSPKARYFHSANSDGKNRILFYGGMGVQSKNKDGEELIALNDLFFLNTDTLLWEYPTNENAPSSRYAHISSFVKDRLIIMGGQDIHNDYLNDICIFDYTKKVWCPSPLSSQQYQYGAYRSASFAVTPIQLTLPFAPTMSLLSEPFEETTTFQETEIIIHTYTNFSTSNITRQLHSWKINNNNEFIEIQDQSNNIIMGNSLPPPLRFPTAFMCGQQFILAGPHLSTTNQQYQIWALDMTSFVWTKIEAGNALSNGSWLKGLLCEKTNRFVVFGHPDRSMAEDYKDRANCFEHLACVNIEIFGIYRPPRPSYSAFGQGLGLSLLKDPALSDLKLITTDGQHILVNSAILAQRWPSIRQLLEPILSPQPTIISTDSELLLESDKREMTFPDTYVVLVAFLQFIYTDHLVTAQQHQPHILARLLFLADLFEIPRLKELSVHALHQMLNIQTASMIYESAILSNAIALQIRALRVLLNAKKLIQRQKKTDRPLTSAIVKKPIKTEPTQPSRFLQKYEQNQLGFSPSVRSVPKAFNTAPQHNRTPSQKSILVDSPPTPSTPSKSMKLSNFRIRQTNNSDTESPISSATSSPKLTPSSSSTTKPSPVPNKSHSSFWRNNTQQKNLPIVMENKPSKSEGTARMGTFNFLTGHN